jgi:hypothetical protein
MSVLGREDLDPEEDARRARAREAYAKMYPLSADDPYGEKRLERVQTVAGINRVFNQVAREWGLGAFVDTQDSEQTRRLEAREVDRNAYREPSCGASVARATLYPDAAPVGLLLGLFFRAGS